MNNSLFSKSFFVKSSPNLVSCPDHDLVEIAFIGRSNVGKSSLINSLVRRKNFAKTSNTPGRTQLLNFFNIADKIMMADLPGYGYAKVSKAIKSSWPKLICDYLLNRNCLTRIFVLIDARRGLKNIDLDFLDMLDETGNSYQIILTKSDKINLQELELVIAQVKKSMEARPAAHPEIYPVSSLKKYGIDDLRKAIYDII